MLGARCPVRRGSTFRVQGSAVSGRPGSRFAALSARSAPALLVLLAILPRVQPIAAGGGQGGPVTFNKDVAPIVFERCASCHHPGGAGPFSLLTYASARQYASQIARATSERYMPPWKADAADGPFVGQHPLTGEQIGTIRRWVDGGAVEGNPADLPPPPRIAAGWQLGAPDLVVTLDRPYTLRADGSDVFRIFVVPLPVDAAPRHVRGVEFLPGNPKVVHHANIRVDRTPASRRYDEEDPGPGYEGLIAHSATYPDGFFLGWTPGQVSPILPKGLTWRLDRGTDLVVEVHMQPSGKPEVVKPSIGLFFGAEPAEKTPGMIRLGRQSIDIPAGDNLYAIDDSYVLPVDVEVQAVQPHAHYRARSLTATATLPDGRLRQLIRIQDWDFRWQHVYRYVTPIALPKGTTLRTRYIYDNSASNPRNPVIPPRRVFWGQRSSDEMGDVWIQVLTRTPADLEALNNQLAPKVMAEDAIGYERTIQSEPASVALHDDVAMLYLRLGRPKEAVAHFERSVALNPGAAATHFNLGTALTVAGRLDEAVEQYREALRLRPDYAQAHNNLGGILLQRAQLAEAVAHIAEARRLDPSNVQARNNAVMAVSLAERHAQQSGGTDSDANATLSAARAALNGR